MELASQAESFRRRGLGLAAIVHDTAADLKAFAGRYGVEYPLLADPDAQVIRSFGLLNVQVPREDVHYGIPYPGTFVTDEKGIIRARFFYEKYWERLTAGGILLREGRPGTGTESIRTDHFVLRTSASDPVITPGNRFTLVLDFEMKPKHHVYAPGARGYRPLALRLDGNPALSYGEPVFPEPRPYLFKPLKETVPVFEGSFRVLQDATLVGTKVAGLQGSPGGLPLEITGTLDYQVCSDTVCHPPASLPVRWTLTVRGLLLPQ